MKTLIIIGLVVLSLLFACSGKDKITVDKTPPYPPILIPHLGDLGDTNTAFSDENNGIDAVPDGDWIRVSWEHFLDSDLDYVKIFRFHEFDNNPILVDSISADNEYYVDSKNQLSTNLRYSYYIEVVDNAGNTALSDTVSYCLLSKQILTDPSNNSIVEPSNVTFGWQKSGNVSKFRLLVFDENHDFLWKKDVQVTIEGDFFEAVWPNNPPQQHTGIIYWRVDAFDWDNELGIFIGSESNEWILNLVPSTE